MGKLVYQPPQDYFVQVSICSVNSFLSLHPFQISINEANLLKVQSVVQHSLESNFILFPEYTYTEVLQPIYQEHCDQNNCIIIGGSGLEAVDNNHFWAYCPVFLPNTPEPIKVYKKHITD